MQLSGFYIVGNSTLPDLLAPNLRVVFVGTAESVDGWIIGEVR